MPQELPLPASSLSDVRSRLERNGLTWLGSFEGEPGEILVPGRDDQPHSIAIIGNVGSALWPVFEAARRNRPDLTLDRWTEETVRDIASDVGVEPVFPFGGPPYHPFIRWAKRTGSLFSSPIGLTIHPTYGLWLAFRAALLIDHQLVDSQEAGSMPVTGRNPCDDCIERPCLSTCPVGAFGDDGYEFPTCLDHLMTPANACRSGGCLARIACPVGQEHRYELSHAAFHMGELLKVHGQR